MEIVEKRLSCLKLRPLTRQGKTMLVKGSMVVMSRPYGWWRPGYKCEVLENYGNEVRLQALKGGPTVIVSKKFVKKFYLTRSLYNAN